MTTTPVVAGTPSAVVVIPTGIVAAPLDPAWVESAPSAPVSSVAGVTTGAITEGSSRAVSSGSWFPPGLAGESGSTIIDAALSSESPPLLGSSTDGAGCSKCALAESPPSLPDPTSTGRLVWAPARATALGTARSLAMTLRGASTKGFWMTSVLQEMKRALAKYQQDTRGT